MYTNNYSNIEISDIVIGKNKMVQFFCLTVYNSYYWQRDEHFHIWNTFLFYYFNEIGIIINV